MYLYTYNFDSRKMINQGMRQICTILAKLSSKSANFVSTTYRKSCVSDRKNVLDKIFR